MTLNDKYLVILSREKLSIYSVIDCRHIVSSFKFDFASMGLENNLRLCPKGVHLSRSNLLVTYRNSTIVTSLTLKSNSLRVVNSTSLEINSFQEILMIYVNSISSEIYALV